MKRRLGNAFDRGRTRRCPTHWHLVPSGAPAHTNSHPEVGPGLPGLPTTDSLEIESVCLQIGSRQVWVRRTLTSEMSFRQRDTRSGSASFSRQRHDRLLSTRLLAPGEPQHQPLGPRVVTQQDRARFPQHLSQQRRPAATNAASAICLGRLKRIGHQSGIRRDLAPILKSLGLSR
jgi:hypothetical protein